MHIFLALLLLFLILLPAWTHEGKKSREAYLKEKQESPWGSRIKKEKGKKWKGERMGVVGVFGMEADLDSEQKTRRGGMNINKYVGK